MYDKNDNPLTNNYFEKRVPEEDYPIKLELDIHSKYENLEVIYDQLFDENSQHVAKVNKIKNSNFLKMKEINVVLMRVLLFTVR
jgi:hypothetical protein